MLRLYIGDTNQGDTKMFKSVPEYAGDVLAFCGGNRALAIANLENSTFAGAKAFVEATIAFLLMGEG